MEETINCGIEVECPYCNEITYVPTDIAMYKQGKFRDVVENDYHCILCGNLFDVVCELEINHVNVFKMSDSVIE